MNTMTISARVAAIRALSIGELDKRQGMLVALAADIVNHETENGALTVAEGNSALECMPYWTTLNEYMRGAGFTKLGNGHFSAAYRHHMLPNKVIKVGFKKEDSGAAYAAFCRMHQGRQGIPTIHDIQRHAGCYTVVLDELEALPQDYWGDMDETHEAYEQFAMLQDVIGDNETREWFDSELMENLYETAREIRKFFEGIARFDMHSGNAMLDKRGNVIITDPVSFSAEDALPQDNFMVDPEELLYEIEQVAERKMIARCKARKAKRDPNGEFRKHQKLRAKARKAQKAWLDQCVAERKLRRVEHKQHVRDIEACKMMIGTEARKDIWWHNGYNTMRNVEAQQAAKKFNHDLQAMLRNNDLMIDKFFDNMFQG